MRDFATMTAAEKLEAARALRRDTPGLPPRRNTPAAKWVPIAYR